MANIFKINSKNKKSKEKAVYFFKYTIDKFKHIMKHSTNQEYVNRNQLYCIFKEDNDKNLYAIGNIAYIDEEEISFNYVIVLYDYFDKEAEMTYYKPEKENEGYPFIKNYSNLILRKANFAEESFIKLLFKENIFDEKCF